MDEDSSFIEEDTIYLSQTCSIPSRQTKSFSAVAEKATETEPAYYKTQSLPCALPCTPILPPLVRPHREQLFEFTVDTVESECDTDSEMDVEPNYLFQDFSNMEEWCNQTPPDFPFEMQEQNITDMFYPQLDHGISKSQQLRNMRYRMHLQPLTAEQEQVLQDAREGRMPLPQCSRKSTMGVPKCYRNVSNKSGQCNYQPTQYTPQSACERYPSANNVEPNQCCCFQSPCMSPIMRQRQDKATMVTSSPNDAARPGMTACFNVVEGSGMRNLLASTCQKQTEINPVFQQCANAKRLGTVKMDKLDLCRENNRDNKIVEAQIDQLVKDTYCPGIIQEAVDGTENFNEVAFELAKIESPEMQKKPLTEPFSLLEAFWRRINMEREEIKPKLSNAKTRKELRDAFQKHFSENHNPTNLNRCIERHLLAEVLAEVLDKEETDKGTFYADIQKGTPDFGDCRTPQIVMYTGLTNPDESDCPECRELNEYQKNRDSVVSSNDY